MNKLYVSSVAFDSFAGSHTFMIFRILITGLLMSCFFTGASQTVTIKGLVTDVDSVSPMPFVFVINKNTGNGLMSDFNGKFVINTGLKDTILFSFVGYLKLMVPVSRIYKANGEETKVVMQKISYDLSPVVVSDFKLKPYERDYMKRVIEDSKMPVVNALQSPITALYMQFSKKGKEQRKLAQIFDDLFEKEQVAKKLNPEILRKLTGDDSIDYEQFRTYCYYLSNQYILTHDGYDLYYRVMDCYYRWKDEKQR